MHVEIQPKSDIERYGPWKVLEFWEWDIKGSSGESQKEERHYKESLLLRKCFSGLGREDGNEEQSIKN
jgi:hypothetical protein